MDQDPLKSLLPKLLKAGWIMRIVENDKTGTSFPFSKKGEEQLEQIFKIYARLEWESERLSAQERALVMEFAFSLIPLREDNPPNDPPHPTK